MEKSAACLLDSDLFFAALTRAHTGLAELRPPRSRSHPLRKTGSRTRAAKPRGDQRDAAAASLSPDERRENADAPSAALRPSKQERDYAMTTEGEPVTVTGKVKFFNEAKGYGFFTRDDGSGDVFVHRTDLPADIGLLYEGQAVSFETEKTKRGLRAVNIALA